MISLGNTLPHGPKDEPGKSWPAVVIGFFVAFGGILYGYDTGIISGILAMPYWQDLFSTGYVDSSGHRNITTSEESLVVSILSAGTFCGALSMAFLSDYVGRRPGIMIATWIFNLGVAFQTAATSIPLFVAGRFFAGLGVGLITAIVPLYQSETAPKWIRGAIIGSYQLSVTIGLLLAAVVNNATAGRNDTGSYRIPVAVQFIFSPVLFSGMLVLPETPRFLIKKNRPEAAAKSLAWIRCLPDDHDVVKRELAEIVASYEHELEIGSVTWKELFMGLNLKRVFTGISVQALSQLSGINFIFYYGTKFFQISGVSSGFTISMITSGINVVSTFPSIFLTDRLGRRPLLLWGAVGMCVCQLLVGICGTISTGQYPNGVVYVTNMAGQRASVAFVCVFIFFFASTCGGVSWVVCGEIFPLNVRAKGISLSAASNWAFNFAIAFSTPYLVNYGEGYANLQAKIFFVWFGALLLGILFVYFFIYETKGLSLEQVVQMYEEVKHARHSTKWKPTTNWEDRQNKDGDVGKYRDSSEIVAQHAEGRDGESIA